MSEPTHRSEHIGKWISIAHRYGRAFLDRQLARDDISSAHLPFIFTLHWRGGLSQHELSDRLGMDKTTTTRAVKSLIALGYISRARDPSDRRVYRLALTAKGKSLLPRIEECLGQCTQVLLAGFSEGEREMVRQLLRRMSENAMSAKGTTS